VLISLAGGGLGSGRALDPFAGSGALGIEALSRGCDRVTFVERDRAALVALKGNIASLGIENRSTVVAGDTLSLAEVRFAGGPFALILLDPPYTLDPAQIARLLERLAASGALEDECIVSWEFGGRGQYVWPQGFEVVQRKRYGTTAVEFAMWTKGESGS
jgi:16S rRNA (guanine966-N2)-methyltransferase